MHLKALSICGYTFSLRWRVSIEMGIDGNCYFGVSTEFKHVSYFPFDGHVILSYLVEMLSGNTYFRWISMFFQSFTLFLSLTTTFLNENVDLTCLILKWPSHIKI